VATERPATETSASAETIKQFEDAAALEKSRAGASTVSSGFKLDNVRSFRHILLFSRLEVRAKSREIFC
jgi:hypothetical protein